MSNLTMTRLIQRSTADEKVTVIGTWPCFKGVQRRVVLVVNFFCVF